MTSQCVLVELCTIKYFVKWIIWDQLFNFHVVRTYFIGFKIVVYILKFYLISFVDYLISLKCAEVSMLDVISIQKYTFILFTNMVWLET